ncbi:hypothetical protein LUZ60_007710 [Juncus effusus]|nr:hypothetical protein LUZ60_007710 [Juncus effusus]
MNQSDVETTRPFRSVKEAAAAFGKHHMTILSSSPDTLYSNTGPGLNSVPDPKPVICELSVMDSIKKLEIELTEIREDLAHMKKRRSEMEIAFASINAQFHKSMSKLAEIEAAEAGERSVIRETWEDENEYLPCFGDALSINGEMGSGMERRMEMKVQREKSLIPLIGGLNHLHGLVCDFDKKKNFELFVILIISYTQGLLGFSLRFMHMFCFFLGGMFWRSCMLVYFFKLKSYLLYLLLLNEKCSKV